MNKGIVLKFVDECGEQCCQMDDFSNNKPNEVIKKPLGVQ